MVKGYNTPGPSGDAQKTRAAGMGRDRQRQILAGQKAILAGQIIREPEELQNDGAHQVVQTEAPQEPNVVQPVVQRPQLLDNPARVGRVGVGVRGGEIISVHLAGSSLVPTPDQQWPLPPWPTKGSEESVAAMKELTPHRPLPRLDPKFKNLIDRLSIFGLNEADRREDPDEVNRALDVALNSLTTEQLDFMKHHRSDSYLSSGFIPTFVPTENLSHEQLYAELRELTKKLKRGGKLPRQYVDPDELSHYSEAELNGDYSTPDGQPGYQVIFMPMEGFGLTFSGSVAEAQFRELNNQSHANLQIPSVKAMITYYRALAERRALNKNYAVAWTICRYMNLKREGSVSIPESYISETGKVVFDTVHREMSTSTFRAAIVPGKPVELR